MCASKIGMYNIEVIRQAQGKNSTLSHLYINGEFTCYVLEDSVRDVKIKGSTAIPAGRYRLAFNRYGGMNARYKRRFPDLHRGMIELQNVPNFSYIYIHIGNTFADTEGCLLVGKRMKKLDDGDYEIYKSQKAYKELYARLADSMEQGEVYLVIR